MRDGIRGCFKKSRKRLLSLFCNGQDLAELSPAEMPQIIEYVKQHIFIDIPPQTIRPNEPLKTTASLNYDGVIYALGMNTYQAWDEIIEKIATLIIETK